MRIACILRALVIRSVPTPHPQSTAGTALRILRVLAIAFAVVPATSCAIGPEVAPPPDVSANRRDGVCGELAHAFRLVGAAKDGGERREEQIERARESVTNPFVTDPDGTLEGLLEIIDLVYARPDLSAAEVEATVLDQCTIDDRGRVVVPKQWPVR